MEVVMLRGCWYKGWRATKRNISRARTRRTSGFTRLCFALGASSQPSDNAMFVFCLMVPRHIASNCTKHWRESRSFPCHRSPLFDTLVVGGKRDRCVVPADFGFTLCLETSLENFIGRLPPCKNHTLLQRDQFVLSNLPVPDCELYRCSSFYCYAIRLLEHRVSREAPA